MTSFWCVIAKQFNQPPTHTNSKLSIAPCYWKDVVYIHEKVLLRTFCFIYDFYTIYRLNVEIQYYFYYILSQESNYHIRLHYHTDVACHPTPNPCINGRRVITIVAPPILVTTTTTTCIVERVRVILKEDGCVPVVGMESPPRPTTTTTTMIRMRIYWNNKIMNG